MNERYLYITWKDGESTGYSDLLPLSALETRERIDEWEHLVEDPSGETSLARCRLDVQADHALLDYEVFRQFNTRNGIVLGVLRVHIPASTGQGGFRVEWKDQGSSVFELANVDQRVATETIVASPIPQTPTSIGRNFNRYDQRAEFSDWMLKNPGGFVLNWPKTGITASMHVVFHRSGCRVLKQRSFPTPEWHKVCSTDLTSLVRWAESRRLFEKAPSAHSCKVCLPQHGLKTQHLFDAATASRESEGKDGAPGRMSMTVQRIVRDSMLAQHVKHLHQMRCQLCTTIIELPGGKRYAEAHHLKPLGGRHKGWDVSRNIVCVCPNCHAKLDLGAITLTRSALRMVDGHSIDDEFIEYHNSEICLRSL